MASTSQPQPEKGKDRDPVLSVLNATIDALNIAEKIATIAPAQAVFGSVSILLTVVKVCSLPMQRTFGSRLPRTLSPTNKVMSVLRYFASESATPLSGA